MVRALIVFAAVPLFLAMGAEASPPPATERPAVWRAAVREINEQLPERHPDWFHRITAPDWDTAADKLNERVPALDEQLLALELSRLVALGGDSHTAVRLPPIEPAMATLPVRFAVMDDGVFIAAANGPHHRLIGARVVGFGPLGADEAIAGVSTLFAWENEHWRRRQAAAFLTIPAALEMIGATPDRQTVRLRVRPPGGEGGEETVTAEALSPEEARGGWATWMSRLDGKVPLAVKGASSFYRSEFLDDSGVMYVQYNKCASAPGFPFPEFARFVLSKCAELDARRIVIDLRENAGGNEGVILPLTVPLSVTERFREPGSIVCLIGPGTYSSGMGNAISLSRIGAVLIGQPTGGKPNSFGEVRSFPLQELGTVVYHSTRLWTKVPDSDPLSLLPDVAVPRLGDDLRTGRDRALEAAISYTPGSRQGPDAGADGAPGGTTGREP